MRCEDYPVISTTKVVDITGWIGLTSPLIAFDNAATCLRPLNVPAITELTAPYLNYKYFGPASFE